MKVFISWSGEGTQSHKLAQAFRDWLPEMFHSVKPFFSSKDIYAGVQWWPKLKAELDAADFGIVCLTRSNMAAPYIMLESGAIAMRIGDTKLAPVLCDMSLADLGNNPLIAFNCVHLTPEGIFKLVESINDSLPEKASEEKIKMRFDRWWKDIAETIKVIVQTPDKDAPAKKKLDLEAAVEQILTNISSQAKQNVVLAELMQATTTLVRQVSLPNTVWPPRTPLGVGGLGPLGNALADYARPEGIEWASGHTPPTLLEGASLEAKGTSKADYKGKLDDKDG
jgi:hypothetical protein